MHRLNNTDIKYLKGVGEARAKLLADELEIKTFRELVYNFPFRHIDRSRFYKISEFNNEMPNIQVRGHFMRFYTEGEGAKRRLIGIFTDGERMIDVVWFSRIKQIKDSYPLGVEMVLFGKPNHFNGGYSFVHPEIERYDALAPQKGMRGVYSLTEKLRKRGFTNRVLQNLIDNVFDKIPDIEEILPEAVVAKLHLMPLHEALRNIHYPTSLAALQKAQERLKFEELFFVQLHILRYTKRRKFSTRGHVFSTIGEKFNRFYSEVLPFTLTDAQKRVIREIRLDMKSGRQMNRLLQGDVGSGKTMVAFMTMLIAIDNRCQACLMAPTEILARQHYQSISEWAEKIGVNVRLLTGSTRTKERREIHQSLIDGSLDILIGTHAVIEDNVNFHNLGMVVIDEQHRFGVAQRARLWQKNTTPPHVLVMTATPIPRTLAMTVYGDLDVSVIDQLPPGRKPVMTLLRYNESRQQVIAAIHKQLQEGRQVYIVYPLIHENEKLSLKSLEEDYQNVCQTFSGYNVCYVHGQMKPQEKDLQMSRFVNAEAQIMVATTVIEVGVNVPNASVMVIENAERFGLSQLHQLRGRVGRGADQSYCILMSKQQIAKETRQRLEIMTQTSDGFIIAEADMKMRGPGDMEGTQQSGLAFNLKLASLAADGQIIQLARDTADSLLESNPDLFDQTHDKCSAETSPSADLIVSPKEKAILKNELKIRFNNQSDWSRIS